MLAAELQSTGLEPSRLQGVPRTRRQGARTSAAAFSTGRLCPGFHTTPLGPHTPAQETARGSSGLVGCCPERFRGWPCLVSLSGAQSGGVESERRKLLSSCKW